jgi:transposase
MDPPRTPSPLDYNHQRGFEIETQHKNAIRELHGFGGKSVEQLMARYRMGKTTVLQILGYPTTTRKRPTRTGRPKELKEERVTEIIEYLSECWENRVLNWLQLRDQFKLTVTPETLATRLKARGYFRCTACQKPYLTAAQVLARFLWAIAHIFWTVEWLKVLWSDEVTFLVGGRTVKQKVTRNCKERFCETCIQHQFHRGGTIPVHAWGAIGYGYKSPLLFVKGSGKRGAFTQKDYLAQILQKLQPILEAFALITHQLRPAVEPLFMEDGNSAHGHKSTRNCCAQYRTKHGIILMPHPSTSPDMNPIEKCWRRIKQALHRRRRQPTTEAEMRAVVLEEWDRIPQDWINKLILQQEHWVHVLMERHGWATPN